MTAGARFTAGSIPSQVARLMKPEDRKAAGIVLPEEAAAKHEARQKRELQRLCEQELSRRGIVYPHLSPRAREAAGWPDLTFALGGRPVAVQVRTKSGKLSPNEVELLAAMRANGWRVYVVRGLPGFDTFRDLLNGHRPKQWVPEA